MGLKDEPNRGGSVTINDGYFEYATVYDVEVEAQDYDIHKDGDRFLLNCADTNVGAKITVNGGNFKNHVPSYEGYGRTGEVVLGEGMSVCLGNGDKVTSAHTDTGTTPIWYTVK